MKRFSISLVVLVLVLGVGFVQPVRAGAAPTVNDMIKNWAAAVGKDFKKVKSKETYVLYSPFTDRTFDTMEATGLETGGTVFPTINAGLQTTITKLKDDLQDLRDKNSTFRNRVNDLVRELRTAARSAAPPTIEAAQKLVYAVYAAVSDGMIEDKERTLLTALSTVVTSTPSLTPAIAADIQASLGTLLSSSGVTATDLLLIKADLTAIFAVLKGL